MAGDMLLWGEHGAVHRLFQPLEPGRRNTRAGELQRRSTRFYGTLKTGYPSGIFNK